MTARATACLELEPDLIAAATGEAESAAAGRVRQHLDACRACRDAFDRYQEIDGLVLGLREEALPAGELEAARADLRARLADLRSRIVSYRVFTSPLGPILIARSEQGVTLVEYIARGGSADSRLRKAGHEDAVEGGAEVEVLHRELMDYLGGRRTDLGWPLDLRLAGSDFDRAVLQATAAIPYGAVTSYARIAVDIGRPSATRAVAQALKRNPLAIAVPCHRIVGIGGDLMGYVGRRISLKQHLLGVEGVPTVQGPADVRVARQSMYVLYPGDDEYCVPTCPSLTPARFGVATLFSTRRGVEAVGVSPCGTCRPDLHPLRR